MAKPSTIRELEEFVRQKQGDFGSKRVQRAADEIPNLERMYTQGALQNAFAGELPQALMTMNPAEFEKFATPIPRQVERLGKRHTRDREEVAFKDYIKHLGKLEGGFDSVPRLEINKQNSLPFHHVATHEGRHRSRALTKNKVEKSLVGLVPQMIDKPMSQEELLQEMRAKLHGRPLVIPQNTYAGVSRRQLEIPDYYAEGGKVDELKDEFMRLAQGGSTMPDDVKAKLDQLKQEFTQLAERDRRAAQATWNAEQMATKKAKGGSVPEHDLLSHPNKSKMIGDEHLLHDSPELKITKAKHAHPKFNSYRYLSYQNDEPVGVLQFMTDGKNPKSAVIQNAYVKSALQKQGIGSNLLARARQDFDLKHSDELSEAGKAFAAKTKAKGGNVSTNDMRYALTMKQGKKHG